MLEAPTTPKKSSSCLLWVVVVMLLGSLGLNFLLTLVVAARGSTGGVKGFEEVVLDGELEDSDDRIVVIPITGMIMDVPGTGMVANLERLLRELKKDEHVKAIVIDVDSPGGGVTASDTIYHDLLKFKTEQKIKAVALFGDVAASGGYYVAMAADHIVCHETSITGSIGVISRFYNFVGLMDKVGVTVKTIKSLNEQGKESFKDIGSPYRLMKPAEEKLLQGLITEMWGRFTRVVAEGRKGKLTLKEVEKLADGRVFTGQQALDAKLIDQLGYREDAYAMARKLCQSEKAVVVQYKKSGGLSDLLDLGASSQVEKLAADLPGQGPRFMYLWTGR